MRLDKFKKIGATSWGRQFDRDASALVSAGGARKDYQDWHEISVVTIVARFQIAP